MFIVDGHVHRVLTRLGFISERASPAAASEMVTASAAMLHSDDLLELFVQMKLLGQAVCRFEAPDCTILSIGVRLPNGLEDVMEQPPTPLAAFPARFGRLPGFQPM